MYSHHFNTHVNAHSHLGLPKKCDRNGTHVFTTLFDFKAPGRVALEASYFTEPKRITAFVALSAHPDGIQSSCDSPEQAFQLLWAPHLLLDYNDLNLLLPGSEESWEVDTFNFQILHRVINSLLRCALKPELQEMIHNGQMLQCWYNALSSFSL